MDNNYKELTDFFDSRYVRKDDCATRHERTENEIKEISINQASMMSKQEFSLRLQWATLGAVITAVAGAIATLIFK